MRQRPLTGRRRSMIALDHFRPFAALLLQLERRLEEVDVEPRRRVEADHHARCFYALEAAVAHQAAHDRTVLLLDERLVVFLVGTRARHFELLSAAPWDDGVVHERAIVVEVDAATKPGEQARHEFHRLDNKRAIARYQRQAFGPARGDIDHRQRLNEQARHRRAAMCDHVDLAVAWRRAVPVVERADRNLAPDRRVESCASPLAAARRDLHIAEQAVDGCRTDGENKITIPLAKLQSAMLLKCRQQGRDHHLETLAAYT